MRVMNFMIAHRLILGTLLGLSLAGCGDQYDTIPPPWSSSTGGLPLVTPAPNSN